MVNIEFFGEVVKIKRLYILFVFCIFCFNHSVEGETNPKELEQFKWLGSKAGITEEVLAPWTPIEVEKQKDGKGLIVKVWGRKYYFKDGPFPTSIETKGNSILANPIKIIAKVDGKSISLQWNPFKIERQTPGIISFTQDATGGGLNLSAVTQIEYDGMIKMDWKLVPQRALKLEELFFEIPMSAKYAKYIYLSGYTDKVGFIPKNSWIKAFESMIWFGDEECGMEWFCESAKDWYNTGRRCIEILPLRDNSLTLTGLSAGPSADKSSLPPESEVVMLRLHLVDKVLSLKPGNRIYDESGVPIMQSADEVVELSYTFGIQATPVKPIIKDVWDYRIKHMGLGEFGAGKTRGTADRFEIREFIFDSLAKSGVRTIVIHDHWTDIFGATTTTYDETLKPIYDNALKKLVKNFHTRGIQFLPYIGFMMSDVEPGWSLFNEGCLRMPKEAWNETRYLNKPPMLSQIPYYVCNRSVWQDYLVDGIDKMMKEYDIDGVYLDGTPLVVFNACNNTLHGCGYIGLDGKIKRTYPIFANRELMKRIYTVIKKHKPEGQVNLHNSLELLAPVMSFATSYWDGEHLGDVITGNRALLVTDPILKKMPLDSFRTEFIGRQWGIPAEFLNVIGDYFMSSGRGVMALCLLHDVPIRGESPFWEIFDKFGRKEAQWFPYWKNKEYVTVTPSEEMDIYASLYMHPKNGVLVVLSNFRLEKAKVKVQLNLQKLKLKGQLSASNVLDDNKPINIIDDTFEISLKAEDYKLVWIQGGD